MLFLALKVVAVLAIVFLVAMIYFKFGVPLLERSRLMKQGVVYMDNPIIGEIKAFNACAESNPYDPLFVTLIKQIAEQKNKGKIPAVTGMCLPSRVFVHINSVEFLDDVFVNYNAYNTKLSDDARMFAIMGEQNVVFMDTFHKDYNQTRKVLSGAFFKNKLKSLTRVIKQEIIDYIAEIQSSGVTQVDIAEFWRQIQGRIFTSVAIGRGNADI